MATKTKTVTVPDYVLEHEEKDKTVKITRMEYPESPLMLEPNRPTTLALEHGRYELGDEDPETEKHGSWADVESSLREKHDIVAMTRVFLYEHTGITISTTPFQSPWDSGCVGIAYVAEEDVPDYEDSKYDRPDDDTIAEWIEDRVTQYDQYLRNEVYGYVVEDEDGAELNRCSGFYGDPLENENLWDYVGDPRDEYEVVGGELS
jgi:hypothetical protein